MDRTAFEAWLGGIAALTVSQRLAALSVLSSAAADCDAAVPIPPVAPLAARRSPAGEAGGGVTEVALLGQRRVESVGCPHCGNRDVARWGKASEMPRYRCKACQRTFNALTKPPLARLRKKDRWAEQAAAMIDGTTLAKAAARCGVHYTTAFRWRHRFLQSLSGDKPNALAGIVESDETFILESFKGKRSDLPRKARKRGGTAKKRDAPGQALG